MIKLTWRCTQYSLRVKGRSLANFNDTISTISTIRLFIYIICSHQDMNERLSCHQCCITARTTLGRTPSQHGEATLESLNSAQWRFQMLNFHPAASSLSNFNDTISTISMTGLFCHVHLLPRKVMVFGVWSKIFFALLSARWILSACFLAILEINVCAY